MTNFTMFTDRTHPNWKAGSLYLTISCCARLSDQKTSTQRVKNSNAYVKVFFLLFKWPAWTPLHGREMRCQQAKTEVFKGAGHKVVDHKFQSLHGYLRSFNVQSKAVTIYFMQDTFE